MMNFIYGVFLSGSMIMAIGAQNIHVIKSGLSGGNVFFVSLTCFLCDFILMFLGVFVVGSLSEISKSLTILICCLSMVFLAYYAIRSFKSSLSHPDDDNFKLDINENKVSILRSIVSTLAVTLLNPHVYLDTVIVVGGYSSSLNFSSKVYFIFGSLSSSFLWFFSLGYFSRYLRKFFNSRRVWVLFDIFVGVFMIIIALNILIYIYKEVF